MRFSTTFSPGKASLASPWRGLAKPEGVVPSRWFNISCMLTLIIGVTVVMLGCIVLAGWAFEVELLKEVFAGLATMKSQTAVTFILTGLSLITIRQKGRFSSRITSRILGGLVAAVGFAVLAEYSFGVNLGIDQLPIQDLSPREAFPGRMAPATAMAFVMIGFGLLLIDKSWRRGIRPAQWCALAGGSISAVAVIGYLLDVPSLYRFSPFSTVALHTAIGLGVSAAGILLSRPGVGLVEIFYSEGVGGTIVRRLVPGAVVTPIVVVWLVGRGEAAGMYGPGLSRALDALALTLGLATLILWSGVNLDRSQRDKIKTEEELQNTEERLRLATDCSNTGLWDWDIRTNEVYFSTIWKRQIGYAEDEIPNRFEEWQSRVHPDDLPNALAKVQAVVAKPRPNYENEFRFRHKDGSYRWILAKASVLLDDKGSPMRMLGSHLDITERKLAEAALRESESRYRDLVEHSEDLICTHDLAGLLLSINPSAARILGYEPTEMLGMNIRDVLAPEVRPEFDQYIATIRTDGAAQGLMRMQTRAGERRTWEYRNTLRTEGVAAPVVRGMAHDVTETLQAKAALRRSEERFRALIEHSQDAIFLCNADGSMLYATPSTTNVVGYLPEELLHHNALEFVRSDCQDAVREQIAESLRRPGVGVPAQAYVRHKDGRWRFLEGTFTNLLHAPSVGAIVTNYRDITERREAEAALRESEERLRLALDAAHIGTYDWNIPLNRVTWSRRHEELWGFRPGEFDGTFEAFAQRVHPDDLVALKAGIADCMASHKSSIGEFRVIWPDGSVHWVSGRGEFYYNDAGEPMRMRGAAIEITERKQTEEALRESEASLREAQRNAQLGSFVFDFASGTWKSSEVLDALLGIDAAWERSLAGWLALVHPDDRARMADYADIEVIGQTATFNQEYRIIRPADRAERWLWTRAVLETDAQGRAVRMCGTSMDITERRMADDALRRSEANYRSVVECASDGIFIVDAQGRYKDGNALGCQMLGYTREELLAMSLSDIVVVEDQARLAPELARLKAGAIVRSEWMYRRKDGTLFPGEVSGTILPDGRNIGILRDITERKQAEESLRLQRQQLRALAARLQQVREEERTRVARDLHDQIGQILTAIKMDVSWLGKRIPAEFNEERNRMQSTINLINDGVKSVRKLCTELRPGILDDLGLVAAIEWQAGEFSARTGISCKVSLPPSDTAIADDHATAVFRIFQEALTNVARHAEARSVQASLCERQGSLLLVVHDDGKGIRDAEIATSLGILGMKERAQACGGGMDVQGVAGQGTTVTVCIPLAPQAVNHYANPDRR